MTFNKVKSSQIKKALYQFLKNVFSSVNWFILKTMHRQLLLEVSFVGTGVDSPFQIDFGK